MFCVLRFYKLDPEKSLRENFVGKTIVEFPQLFLILTGCFTAHKAPKYIVIPGIPAQNLLIPSNSSGSKAQMVTTTTTILSTSEESENDEDSEQMDSKGNKLPRYRDLIL